MIFEATDQEDYTSNLVFSVFRDEGDTGAYVNFCEDIGKSDGLLVRDMMWLDPSQCEQFGNALLAAAKVIREAEANAG